ncbi:hypothetical protein BH09PSE5_BH09PSE5_02150 [soil metagenome]
MKPSLADAIAWLSPSRIPAYLIGGINVAAGMTFVAIVAYLLGGTTWALGAALGAIVTSMPDQVGRPQNKMREVLPGTLLGATMYLSSQLTHGHTWMSMAAIVCGSFVAALPQAWGKRGAPLSVAMLFSLVIPLAAPPVTRIEHAFLETALFIGGGLVYMGFTVVTAQWFDSRYRTLAVADCTEVFARLLRLQAESMREGTEPGTAPVAVSRLVLEQTNWADRLQIARDLVFNTLDKPRHRQLAAVLFTLVEARDQLLTCQLDLDLLMATKAGRDAVPELSARLEAAASHCDVITVQLRRGDVASVDASEKLLAATTAISAVAAATDAATVAEADAEAAAAAPKPKKLTLLESIAARLPRYAKPWARAKDATEPMVVSVVRDRHDLLLGAVQSMSVTLADPMSTPPLAQEELQLFTTPTQWSWKFLKERLKWRSPIVRFALRSALAMGVAFAVAESLPWADHKQWILISVAVVLRSNYAQTAERRKLRLVGTAIGCLVTSALLATTDNNIVIFLSMIVAAGAAHAFPLVNYTVTATAASVLGLLQTHLIAPYASFVVWERMIDTVLGIALAWVASFVLPSWERQQVPGLVSRVLQSQARYVELTLAQFDQPTFAVDWRLARREVYDALTALTLGIQRMQSEPRQVRLPVDYAASLLAHAHELMAQMAAVQTLLALRRANLDPVVSREAIERSAATLGALLNSTAPAKTEPVRPTGSRSEPEAVLPLLPPEDAGDLTAWLVRRLSLAEQEARLLVAASIPVKNAALAPLPPKAAEPAKATR